eukprot:gb/GEZN01003324.1/.p1 GENE.gb/GEZN01003324.1/~~gb/GEZN01003324.1/.p1  ORF type:complete len:569 (-),score=82.93 gb/GEZN01003324.1/:134-1840(-)
MLSRKCCAALHCCYGLPVQFTRTFFNKPPNPLKRFGRVISNHGHNVMVELLDQGSFIRVFPCSVSGKGKNSKNLDPVVGDYVLCHIPIENNTGVDVFGFVTDRLPRRSIFARAKDKMGRSQVLAANVDHLALVTAPEPPTAPLNLDRFLSGAHLAGMSAMIIFNKIDLLETMEHEERNYTLNIIQQYEDLGYPVHRTTAADPNDPSLEKLRNLLLSAGGARSLAFPPASANPHACDEDLSFPDSLRLPEGCFRPYAQVPFKNPPLPEEAPAWYMDWLQGADEPKHILPTWVFVGQSGSGKTSILNALLPDLNLYTNELSRNNRGRHTTSTAELHQIKPIGDPLLLPDSSSSSSPCVVSPPSSNTGPGRPALSPKEIASKILNGPRDWQDLGPPPKNDNHIIHTLTKPASRVSIIDSPGFENYYPPKTRPEYLRHGFPDFDVPKMKCAIPSRCTHAFNTDPKLCGVRKAGEEGVIAESRMYSYDYIFDTLRDFDKAPEKVKRLGNLRHLKRGLGQKNFPYKDDPFCKEHSWGGMPKVTKKTHVEYMKQKTGMFGNGPDILDNDPHDFFT